MLVASRDPFHGGHDAPSAPSAGGRFAHTMSMLQVVGTVLAIPVGLGSAYTMYKSNFTAEASCQALRANIIQILDKSVDASARHMLVRRDVVTFEQTCGDFDPDAAAAFKTLLSADKSVAAVAPAPRRLEAQPKIADARSSDVKPADVKAVEAKPVERRIETKVEAKADTKAEPRQDAIAKIMAAKPVAPVAAVATPPLREQVNSDAEWLEAVRLALVTRGAETAPAADAPEAKLEPKHEDVRSSESKSFDPRPAEARAPIAAPLVRQAVREAPPMSIENVRTPPLATVSAPALPPPSAVGSVPAPREETLAEPRLETVRADSHPVPPGAIPETGPSDMNPPEERSRIGQLISHIPFANRLLDK